MDMGSRESPKWRVREGLLGAEQFVNKRGMAGGAITWGMGRAERMEMVLNTLNFKAQNRTTQ